MGSRTAIPAVAAAIVGVALASFVLPATAQVQWGSQILDQPPDWYASTEARTAATTVIRYQSPEGGWPKNTDLLIPPAAPIGSEQATIDNGATTTPMRFLALVAHATADPASRYAFERGLDYLLAAQYDNGGWPQYYPLRDGYYSRITYNDDAMVNVLTLLREVTVGAPPYEFVDDVRRARARAAVAAGVGVILRTQIRQNGQLTGWCAQHDEHTLEPAWGRAYEPPSISGGESVGVVRFLMSLDEPTPEIRAAIEGAVEWLRSVAIPGVRVESVRGDDGLTDRFLVADPSAPPVWARFYELGSSRPLYVDRDSVFRYDFSEIGPERRGGYAYHGDWPASLLATEYPEWRSRHGLPAIDSAAAAQPQAGAMADHRHRVLVSSDIGGTDPDDFQSMVHLLLYADALEIEGLVSSPQGPGRKAHILQVIDYYEQDYPNLASYSGSYPTPDALRAIVKQGATDAAGYAGVGIPTEGSEWIVARARADDPRPLYVLIWGGLEDLAQALHDAPDILPKLRVYWIGGPNKKWSPDAYQYIVDQHPRLWMIEANATYRGWFVGGNQTGAWGHASFVAAHVAGHGALGDYFAELLGGEIKMGDSPSVAWLLDGTPADPSAPGWGGRFVRAWDRPYDRFKRMTTEADQMQAFGILELALPLGPDRPARPEARLEVENQSLVGYLAGDGTMRFRFSPKGAGTYAFIVRSNVPGLDGLVGGITAVTPPPDAANRPSSRLANWWTDDPDPQIAEGEHLGARTVSRWREAFLGDFADRLRRADQQPNHALPRPGGTPGLSE